MELTTVIESMLREYTTTFKTEPDILDEYLPLIKQCADKDAYIDANADTIMVNYPSDDASMQEKVDYFASVKENKRLIEAHLEAINKAIKDIQNELIMWMETNPVKQLLSTDGKLLSKVVRTNAKVISLQALKESLGREWSKYEGVNQKALNALVKEIKQQADEMDVNLDDLLPAGVSVSLTSYLSMRNASTGGGKKTTDEVSEFLMDLILEKEE